MRGREFPPPLLPSQLLKEKDESGNQIQDGGGKVDVEVGLTAPLFPLAHGFHLLSMVLLYHIGTNIQLASSTKLVPIFCAF